MNMLEKQAAVKTHCLATLEQNFEQYPGYPEQRFIDLSEDGSISVPFLEKWDTEEMLPSGEDIASLQARMCRVDELGRPVHPWYEEMVRSVGVVAGRGKYWNWGPNHTVDPIVITTEQSPKILLIEREDNGCWAFPGGFLDYAAESTNKASIRECAEETALNLKVTPIKTIYRGVVSDARTTAHAWAYTTAKLWRVAGPDLVSGQDDALQARWFPVAELPKNLHGSHAKIIELALAEL